jgi:hypothetical protein
MINNKQKLEKNLGYKVMDNITCLGVDTATSTGLALIKIKKNKVTIETSTFKLPTIPKKIADQLEKAEKYEKAMESGVNLIREYMKDKKIETPSLLVLEQSFLLMIGKRVINPETYGYLRSLGGVYYSELFDYFDNIKIYLATVARKLSGFHSKLERGTERTEKKQEICKWISNIIQEEIKDDNCADALMLSFAGIKK